MERWSDSLYFVVWGSSFLGRYFTTVFCEIRLVILGVLGCDLFFRKKIK